MCYKAENVDLSFIFFLLFLNWYLLYAFPRSYDRSHPVTDLIKCSNFLVFSKTIHRLWSRSNSGGVHFFYLCIYLFTIRSGCDRVLNLSQSLAPPMALPSHYLLKPSLFNIKTLAPCCKMGEQLYRVYFFVGCVFLMRLLWHISDVLLKSSSVARFCLLLH